MYSQEILLIRNGNLRSIKFNINMVMIWLNEHAKEITYHVVTRNVGYFNYFTYNKIYDPTLLFVSFINTILLFFNTQFFMPTVIKILWLHPRVTVLVIHSYLLL
jgi:hypothetical protein